MSLISIFLGLWGWRAERRFSPSGDVRLGPRPAPRRRTRCRPHRVRRKIGNETKMKTGKKKDIVSPLQYFVNDFSKHCYITVSEKNNISYEFLFEFVTSVVFLSSCRRKKLSLSHIDRNKKKRLNFWGVLFSMSTKILMRQGARME